jgi:DNA polymerase
MGSSLQSTQKTLNPYVDLPEAVQGIVKAWKGCQDCELHKGICNYVFFRGSAPCDVLFIGEAPGNDEDLCGLPFVGRSGAMLESWIALAREEGLKFTYGITNIVACIPKTLDEETGKKGVRPPTKQEADACKLRLLTTIQRCSPSLIVVVGKTAKKYLRIPARGMEKEYNTPVLELQHPAYILRKGGRNSLEYKRNYLYLKEAIENL